MAEVFRKVEGGIDAVFDNQAHSHTHPGRSCDSLHPPANTANRFQSFAPQSSGRVKWFVDGCSYFWAVSEAIQNAKRSIHILDWWLSPELYLRRPPAANEQYRLDVMLKSAAERGVKVNIIVYREVSAALSLNSSHTKTRLESLHSNIHVFRHPDHVPTGYDAKAELGKSAKNLKLIDLANASRNAIKSIYGCKDDVVLYWAHHEKLLIVDDSIGFMGGLDLSHPIADHHPVKHNVVFPGQDYNNARVSDFADVNNWDQNKLDRGRFARMGWSDVAICMSGPIVHSLKAHFIQRWNYIHKAKYEKIGRANPKYSSLDHSTDLGAVTSNGFWSILGLSGRSKSPTDQDIQLIRSCTKWSHGQNIEHSIANAYIESILNAENFVYIENQFFITATNSAQHPITNRIGLAIVNRILRAYREGKLFKVWVVMPAVPAFAGDLKSKDALGTRAIMKYQYNSICRGGHSIVETLEKQGIPDPKEYINFYNLRTFDRINTNLTGGYDTISSSYMHGKAGLLDMPWNGDPNGEIDAFVSEQLYIHSKLLIADDRTVICGSANLNDRSQLGTHDSEIAVVIREGSLRPAVINGKAYEVSSFAASLRRHIFRKHIGLLPDQRWDEPNGNFRPIIAGDNDYDWGSPEDLLVADPLSPVFLNIWSHTATTNTAIYRRAFHPVPDDNVRTWQDYDRFFSKHFDMPQLAKGQAASLSKGKTEYGHVVASEFNGGVAEVKAWLSRVQGSLVDMPLNFLADEEDIAQQGWSLNSLTDELYT